MHKSDSPLNINQQKQTHKWSAKQAIAISLLAYFVAQIFVAIPIIVYSIARQGVLDDNFLSQSWVSLMLSGVSAVGLFTTIALFFRYKKISFKELGFKKIKSKNLAYPTLAYIAYLFVLVSVISFISVLFPEFNPEQAQDVGYADAKTLGWQLGLAFIGLVVVAPIAEEMLFRGFLYKGLRNSANNRVLLIFGLIISVAVTLTGGLLPGLVMALLTIISSILIKNHRKLSAAIFSAMLFGLVHMQWNVALDTFILSFALVWVFERTDNLWMPILLHATKNFVAFVFVFDLLKISFAG